MELPVRSSLLATSLSTLLLMTVVAVGCGGDSDESPAVGGTAGSGTAGSGTAGSGTAGNGTAGSGTAGSGTAGSGTAGSGTAGSGTAGSGTAGSGTAGTGTAGAAGSGTSNHEACKGLPFVGSCKMTGVCGDYYGAGYTKVALMAGCGSAYSDSPCDPKGTTGSCERNESGDKCGEAWYYDPISTAQVMSMCKGSKDTFHAP